MLKKLIGTSIGILAVAASALAAETAAPAAAGSKPWKMSGQLEEACSCDAACPCWFDSKPSRMTCSGGQVVFIEKGTYGGVPLDGLSMAAMGQSPENQTMMESFGKWNFANLYIDEKANPEQRAALQQIAMQMFGPAAPADKMKVAYVPIQHKIEKGEHSVVLGSVGGFSGHLVEGGMGSHPKITNPPGADPLHREYEQGRTTAQTYTDAGQNWNWSNSNYMYGTFEVNSDEYAKFAAGLAQKMGMEKK